LARRGSTRVDFGGHATKQHTESRVPSAAPSSLSDLTANSLILLSWYYFLEAKLLSLFKGLKISMMPSPTGC
jgi:hypothetical protein